MSPTLQQGTLSRKIILIKCLDSVTPNFAILHMKWINFGNLEKVSLNFLNTEFHWLPTQDTGMMSN